MDARIDQALTLRALTMTLASRGPKPGLAYHSDRGSQYAAKAYRRTLASHDIEYPNQNSPTDSSDEAFFLQVDLLRLP